MRSSAIAFLILAAGCAGSRLHRAELATLEHPDDPDHWVALGRALARTGDQDGAAGAFARARELGSDHGRLGRSIRGNSHTASMVLREALRAPNDDEVWGDAGDQLLALGYTDGARSAYQRASELDPADTEWHIALAQLGGDTDVVEAMAEHLDPNDDESLGNYGDMLMAVGRTDEACQHYRAAHELDPGDGEWQQYAPQCGYELLEGPADILGIGGYEGEISIGDTAAPWYADGADLGSLEDAVHSDTSLLVELGRAHAYAGNGEEADRYLRGALLVDPTNTEALDALMALSGHTKRKLLEDLLGDVPDNDELVGELGDHYLELGDRRLALKMYRQAIELDESDPEWRTKLELLERIMND